MNIDVCFVMVILWIDATRTLSPNLPWTLKTPTSLLDLVTNTKSVTAAKICQVLTLISNNNIQITKKFLQMALKNLFKNRTTEGDRKAFNVKVGLHQGSVLSPLLFVIVMEMISRELRAGLPLELL